VARSKATKEHIYRQAYIFIVPSPRLLMIVQQGQFLWTNGPTVMPFSSDVPVSSEKAVQVKIGISNK